MKSRNKQGDVKDSYIAHTRRGFIIIEAEEIITCHCVSDKRQEPNCRMNSLDQSDLQRYTSNEGDNLW